MDCSLSVILPVRNFEHLLAERLHQMMESVAELSAQIEILIIDDGSTDNTEEVAVELSLIYPQITVERHAIPRGATEAAHVGVQHSRGEVILIHNLEYPLSDEALRHLWAMRDDEELVIASSESGHPQAGRSKPSWMDVGTKLLRREAVEALRTSHDSSVIINRVTRTDLEATPPSPAALPTKLVQDKPKPPQAH